MSPDAQLPTTLVARLVAFADLNHEHRPSAGCHPEPGVDCMDWCEACKILADVPEALLKEARRVQVEEWGYDR